MERWGSVVFPFSRVTFSEVLTDQSAPTAAGFLRRATAWFGSQGITIERVLSDNGGCYRSREFLKTCAELSIAPRRTRPYRPQTNGKEERMIQTLIREWAYRDSYRTSFERTGALAGYLPRYNFHRKHSAIGRIPTMPRIRNNVLGSDTLVNWPAFGPECRRLRVCAEALDVVNELPRLFGFHGIDKRWHRCSVQTGHEDAVDVRGCSAALKMSCSQVCRGDRITPIVPQFV